jgi:hypothetical protein
MHESGTRFVSTARVKAFRRRLEAGGYLDPNRRGDRADECDAIEAFLAEALVKPR